MKKILVFIVIITILAGVFYSVMKTVFPLKHEKYIELYSKEYEIDPYLIMGIIKAESNFEVDAVSSKSATGLMQITKSTAEWIADKLSLDNFEYDKDIVLPEINIRMGCFYIGYLLDKLSVAIYKALRGGFLGYIFSAYYSELDSFENGLFGYNLRTGGRVRRFLRHIRGYFAESIENS